ncbi:MAG: hypothetical protein QXG38_02215, partial [Candidatus Hadarchaeales archaeon]
MEKLVELVMDLKRGEVGETVARRIDEFKRIGREGDERWFSELCFCILTANSSAKLGIKIQEELGSDGFIHLPFPLLAKKLREAGHRVYSQRAR